MDERTETVLVERLGRVIRGRAMETMAEAVKSFKEEEEHDEDRVRTARPEFVEELKAPAGTHFHVLVVTYSKDLAETEPRWSEDRKVQLILNPSLGGKYTEHSLVGTDIKEIVTLARKLGGPFQTEWAIFRVRQVENGFCARLDLVTGPE